MRFTSDDHDRVAAAIAAAEAKTSGEIFCVFARRVSTYRDVAMAWAAGCALLLPLGLIPLGFDPAWLRGVSDNWQAAHLASTGVLVGQTLAAYALVQAVVFVIVLGLGLLPPVARLMTPASLRRERVRRAALDQFLAHGLHITEARTGVMIFAAAEDRQVEVIADEGIHGKVDAAVWGDAVAALTREMRAGRPVEGFEKAIALCGGVLAGHFPPRGDNPNEVADRLVEL